MRIKTSILVVSSLLLLTGCTGPGEYWEPRTYGVRNSEWQQMSDSQRYYTEKSYRDAEHLKQQSKIEKKIQAEKHKVYKLEMENARLEKAKIQAEIKAEAVAAAAADK